MHIISPLPFFKQHRLARWTIRNIFSRRTIINNSRTHDCLSKQPQKRSQMRKSEDTLKLFRQIVQVPMNCCCVNGIGKALIQIHVENKFSIHTIKNSSCCVDRGGKQKKIVNAIVWCWFSNVINGTTAFLIWLIPVHCRSFEQKCSPLPRKWF